MAEKTFNVGVSPSLINLGDVEMDSTELVNFYIITPSEEDLLVKLEPFRANLDFFKNPQHQLLITNFSEEDVTSWVKILENPVLLEINNEPLGGSSGTIKGSREISFLLEIPKDAEPGLHLVNINPIPTTPSGGADAVGTRVVAITSENILFNVVGEALRDGKILDVELGKYIGNRLEIKTYFKNTGTVTITARADQKIYKDSVVLKEFSSSVEEIKPEEIKTIKSYINVENLDYGEYQIKTLVDFTTGNTSLSSSVVLIGPVSVPEEETLIPIWLIVLILILLILIIIYRRMK